MTRNQVEMLSVIRATVGAADDDQLVAFMTGYALGAVADHLIAIMSPADRAGFFATMRAKYPDLCWPGKRRVDLVGEVFVEAQEHALATVAGETFRIA